MGGKAPGEASVGPRGVVLARPVRLSFGSSHPFVSVLSRLGRHILTSRQSAVPAAAERWQRHGLSRAFLTAFWRRLWDSH